MATNLGELFYSLRIKDLTQQDIDSINTRLKNLGSNITIDPQSLKRAAQNAANGAPIDLKVGGLKDLQTAVNAAQAGMTGLKLKVDGGELSREINQILASNPNLAKAGIGADGAALRKSITDALRGYKFPVEIQVVQNQARMAVQNALNGVGPVSKADVWKYEHLQRGENQAALAQLNQLRAAQLQAGSAARTHASASLNLGEAMSGNIRIAGELGAAMASLYSIHAAKEFLQNIIEIGGELEHQKIALDTIYGDPGKTQTLFSQIKSMARQSPFGVMDLTKNIKQLSAYGVAYNEVYDTAKRLADISAATSVDINRLILAFGKTKNRTFLDGLEAKQFAYANIPIYDALSKKLTELEGKFVSVKDVMGRIKKREIGFDMVREILWDMTDEGGKFYNMQEKLAGSVKTSWKLVRDNIELMFGEIAESGAGKSLKSLGELLQGLTREWRLVATVVTAGATAFGISKLATLSLSRAMESGTASMTANILAGKKKTAEDLQRASITRSLSAAEKELIATQDRLTAADLQNAMSKQNLTQAQLKQLYVSKQVSLQTLDQMVKMNALTQAQYKAIVGTNMLGVSLNRVKGGFTGLWHIIKNAGQSLWAFATNPMTILLTALSAGVALWQRNKQEMEKAKEIGDNLFTKANEGARNLEKTIKEIKAPEGLSQLELTQGIERMEEALKDYSPSPLHDINDALYTQEGLIRPIEERYERLRQKLGELKDAFDVITQKDLDSTIEGAINATNGGWFNDDINTNLKDYSNALKKLDDQITKFYSEHTKEAAKYVKEMRERNPLFAEATKNMKSDAQAFKELIKNSERYGLDLDTQPGMGSERFLLVSQLGKYKQAVKKARIEVDSDLELMSQFFKTRAKEMGIQSFENTTEGVRKAFATMVKDFASGLEVTDDIKDMVNRYFAELFRIDIDNSDLESKLAEQFSRVMESALGKVVSGKIRNGLTLNSTENQQANHALYQLWQKSYEMASEEEKKGLMEAFDKVGGKLVWNAQKASHLLGTLNNRAGWSEWQKSIDDNFGNDEHIQKIIKDSHKPEDLVDKIQKGYKEVKDNLNKIKPMLGKVGIDIDFGELIDDESEFFEKAGPYTKELTKEWNEFSEQYESIKEFAERYGIGLKEPKSSGKGSNKDEFAERMKQRLKDLKDAWSEYKKWEKSVGDEAAAEVVAGSELFGDMKAEDIPRTVEEYEKAIEKLKEDLKRAGVNTSQRESLLNDMLKTLLDVKKAAVDEEIEKALAVVDQEIERKLEDWNLYEKIRQATGNRDLAYSFSFGNKPGAQTDYTQMVKENFNSQLEAVKRVLKEEDLQKITGLDSYDLIDFDNYTKLPKELQKAWETAYRNISQYRKEQREFVAGLLAEYQNTMQQIAKIEADAEEKIRKVWNDPNLNDGEKQNLEIKIDTKAKYDIFTKSNEYLQFFGGVMAMTQAEAENVGASIRQHLNEELQNGVITAEEYVKEVEKVEEILNKRRGDRGDAWAFMTGGVMGMKNKQLERETDKRMALLLEIKGIEEEIEQKRAEGDAEGVSAAEKILKDKIEELKLQDEKLRLIWEEMDALEKSAAVTQWIGDKVEGVAQMIKGINEMAGALGFDSESSSWLDVEGVLETFSAVTSGVSKMLSSALNGNIGGIISGAFSTITDVFISPITLWSKIHDRKLQKDIEASERQFDRYQALIDRIEGKMDHFLGNRRNVEVDLSGDREALDYFKRMSKIPQFSRYYSEAARKYQARIDAYEKGGALGYERQLMEEQLAELERQRSAYEQMKGDHRDDISDLTAQIEEQRQAIRDYAEEMANAVYGIDLGDWASQIGDALVDAFAKGEDAAEAFKKTVDDIMRDVVSNVVTQNIIAPAMQEMQDWLFGKDGQGGAYGEDFWLDEGNVADMYAMMGTLEEAAERAWEFMENVDGMTGGRLKDSGKESSVRAGIQAVTEDTADLLASYVNAIRAYCAENVVKIDMIVNEALPRLNLVAEGQLQQLRMIAENTRRNMEAAELMRVSLANVESLLGRVTKGTSVFYVK